MSARAKKPPVDDRVIFYRSRPTAPDPFGEIEEPTVGTLDEVLARGRADRAGGLDPVIEYRVPGAAWSPYHPVVLVPQLVGLGFAKVVSSKKLDPNTGKMVGSSGHNLTPEGQQIIYDAMRADPLTFTLDDYRRPA